MELNVNWQGDTLTVGDAQYVRRRYPVKLFFDQNPLELAIVLDRQRGYGLFTETVEVSGRLLGAMWRAHQIDGENLSRPVTGCSGTFHVTVCGSIYKLRVVESEGVTLRTLDSNDVVVPYPAYVPDLALYKGR
jgi:hypothetical protein